MCPHRCESLLFFSTVCCPAVRIHNHTVLPSSHNSSSVYTNDSAYTNISATVGEHWVSARLLLSLLSKQSEPSVSPPKASLSTHSATGCVCVDAVFITFTAIKARRAHVGARDASKKQINKGVKKQRNETKTPQIRLFRCTDGHAVATKITQLLLRVWFCLVTSQICIGSNV